MNKLFLLIFSLFAVSSASLITKENKNEDINRLKAPIHLDSDGIKDFFKTVFKDPQYGTAILPDSFFHLEQLLSYGHQTDNKKHFVRSVFRLFTNKLKSSLYVNAYATQHLFEKLPLLLAPYIASEQEENSSIKDELVTLLYDQFFAHFEEFKQDPDDFFSRLSDDIVKRISTSHAHGADDATQIRSSLHFFLDLVLNRLIWDPTDEARTWETVKAIGASLGALKDQHLIESSEALDDLYNSLIERYCVFLDLMQGNLSIDCFVTLKERISKETSILLDSWAAHGCATSRREQLLHTIHHGETHARAREYGYTQLEEKVVQPEQKKIVVEPQDKTTSKRKRRRSRRSGKLH